MKESQFMLDEKEAFRALEHEIDRQDLEYADNYRVYKEGDEEGRIRYEDKEKSGCCGFFDSSTMVNGHKWYIGCNYGH